MALVRCVITDLASFPVWHASNAVGVRLHPAVPVMSWSALAVDSFQRVHPGAISTIPAPSKPVKRKVRHSFRCWAET